MQAEIKDYGGFIIQHIYLQREWFILLTVRFKIQNYPHWWQNKEKQSCWSIELEHEKNP